MMMMMMFQMLTESGQVFRARAKSSAKTTYHYILFERFTRNIRGYFVSCIVFFSVLKGKGKI